MHGEYDNESLLCKTTTEAFDADEQEDEGETEAFRVVSENTRRRLDRKDGENEGLHSRGNAEKPGR